MMKTQDPVSNDKAFLAVMWAAFAIAAAGLLICLLSGCESIPFLGDEEDRAYSAEYDYTKPHGRTACGSRVYFPTWLAREDRPKVLAHVQSMFDIIRKEYPASEPFLFGSIRVFVSDSNLGAFVAGYGLRIWVYGWQVGNTVYVCWQPTKDASGKVTGLSATDCLYALPHEVFHMILDWQHKRHVPHEDPIWSTQEVVNAIHKARLTSEPVVLTKESLDSALAYKYVPWCDPKNVGP